MDLLKEFGNKLSALTVSPVDRAVALLWFYRQTQAFDERSPNELSSDLHELGFPKANGTRLSQQLKKSKFVIKGKRKGTFQLDARKIAELDLKYLGALKKKTATVSDAVIPKALVTGTRAYIEKLVAQINGCYDNEWYDGSAVLSRRLVESLIIECYLAHGLRAKIEVAGNFKMLDALISIVKNETGFKIARNSGSTMSLIKEVGDTAAHDRTYITQKQDIDDIKLKLRPLISDLLSIAKIRAAT